MFYCMYCCQILHEVKSDCTGPYYTMRQSKHDIEMIPMKHIQWKEEKASVDRNYLNKLYLKRL